MKYPLIICSLFLFCDCSKKAEQQKFEAPLFEGLGDLHYPVSSKNEDAQNFFNQGLTLSYAFNHAEAKRSFKEAARLDSTCGHQYQCCDGS